MRDQETLIVLHAIKAIHNEVLEMKSKVDELRDTLERIEQTGVLEPESYDDDDDDEEEEEDEWATASDLESVQSAPF